jgi:transposase
MSEGAYLIIKELQEKIAKLEQENQKLSEELNLLKQKFFASKQEKNSSPNAGQKISKKSFPHNKNSNADFDFSPAVELIEEEKTYTTDDFKCKNCNSGDLIEMTNAFEESNEIDVQKQKYINRRHKRQKYKCNCCQKITTAPGGVKLTKGSEFSITVATQIACDKFEDHLPLERQRKQFLRNGLKIEVKTLYGLTEHLHNRLTPLLELIKIELKIHNWIHIDESPMTFYNKKKDSGYIWSISNPIGVYYQFEGTRAGIVAREMLRGYNGVVVSDAFSGYSWISENENMIHAYCWAHVRRKFFDAIKSYPVASGFVDLIDKLYEVEREANDLDQLKKLRSEKSIKLFEEFNQKIQDLDGGFMSESLIGKAINYYLSGFERLKLFLENENVPIDNNMAERMQRGPVMGRKNFLHFKSINGADVGMLFYSIIESCKLNGLEPRLYIEEMALKSAKGEGLETPFGYASRKIKNITGLI